MNDQTRALVLSEDARAMALTEERLALITRTVAQGASPDELAMFLTYCRRTGLDPFSKQIYCIVRNTKDGKKAAIQTGIDGYRLVAERSHVYAGSDDVVFDEGLTQWEHRQAGRGLPATATATVYKLIDGERMPFTATAAFEEYKPERGDAMWQKMPYLMLGKCAEALALRKAFPQELSGVYVHEEMHQAGPSITVEARTVERPPAARIPPSTRIPPAATPSSSRPPVVAPSTEQARLLASWAELWREAKALKLNPTPITSPQSMPEDELAQRVQDLSDFIRDAKRQADTGQDGVIEGEWREPASPSESTEQPTLV